ncbi:MAG: helix-turn-helix domain-containing protein [Hyphomonadaceae bacterium]|nr:helix-turn-helix domain-containing protein [Hyphomonadaceae bacterium]
MANVLPLEKRAQILSMLCEGVSMRAISRLVGVSINTVSKLLADAGETCLDLHDELVRGVAAQRVQCDEIWSFNYAKEKNVATAKAAPADAGDIWTWTAIDPDSKLMLAYVVAGRTPEAAHALMSDLAARLSGRVQLTTDGLGMYRRAVDYAFGENVDFAQLVKVYGEAPGAGPERKYSPPVCVGAHKVGAIGNPDPKHISTSHVERANLTMRMGMRRFTRLTNAHSKKYANHLYALALFFMHYNFVRQHKAHKLSPAMAAGIADRLWSVEDIVTAIDARAAPAKKRGPYKKRAA